MTRRHALGGLGPALTYQLEGRLVALGGAAALLLASCGAATGDGEQRGHGGAGASGAGGAQKGGAGAGMAGSAGTSAGAGGTAGGTGGASAGTSGASPAAGSGGGVACGATTCGAAQYCIFPCCGGAPPSCFQLPDGVTCPTGTHSGCLSTTQCTSPATCCQPDPCMPGPPHCSDTLPIGCFTEGHTCHLTCA